MRAAFYRPDYQKFLTCNLLQKCGRDFKMFNRAFETLGRIFETPGKTFEGL